MPVPIVGSVIGAFVGAFVGAFILEGAEERHLVPRRRWRGAHHCDAAAVKVMIGFVMAVWIVLAVIA